MIDFKKSEEEVLGFWKQKKIYEKVKSKSKKGKKFYFLQGPPYTSGKIHIGHAWNNSLKDIILRFKRMNGFDVWDRAGYDMHGLPTENAVQKKLGFKNKEEIEKFGVDKFVRECMNFSVEHANYMNEDLWKLGIWMDYKNAYMPVKKEFVGGEWAFFKKAHEQKRLYKGVKVMHWDSETETSLAKHELEYENIKDTSVFLKFKKENSDNEYFVVWTTTPWTIPYNLAIMVNPDVDYVKAKVDDEIYIVAKDLVDSMEKDLGKKFKIIEKFKGKKLEGEKYVHVLEEELKDIYSELKKKSPKIHSVILNKEYVDTASGTGIVHCAPGCGPEDQEAAEKYGIKSFNTLNEQGILENMGKYSGWKAKEEDYKFIKEFEEKKVLLAVKKIEHEYPHSWRSHKPVVFRTTEQWFLKTTDLIDKLLKFNKKVYWVPKKSGESYERWAENLKDNGVTRQRYWGCPVPIWVNVKDSKDYFVIGSVEELEKYAKKKLSDLEVHRPWIDKIVIKKNGKQYKRIEDVADVWLDSGTASWNCLYNDPKLIKKYFPADLVLEATEQTRLWFSLLQICSAVMFDKSSYENVFVHGMILDFQGTKMSKSIGNVISPYEVIDKYSADILRYYICESTAGENINFSWEDVKQKQRNLIVLLNIKNYLVDLLKQGKLKKINEKSLGLEEKYILSRANSTIKKITELFENYNIEKTINEIEKLFLDLSRVYIKLTRDKSNDSTTRDVVASVILEVYEKVLKIFSPICPLLTEKIWQELKEEKIVKEESVHLSSWPGVDKKLINKKLEDEFEIVLKIIEKGLAERDKIQIGLKWPLASAKINCDFKLNKNLEEIVKNQLNVKDIKVLMKKNGEISVEFDTKITPELEAEGYAREMTRQVQAFRKKIGLEKKDRIELLIVADEKFKVVLEKEKRFIGERTNAKGVEIVTTWKERFKNKNDFKIKDKRGGIGIIVTNQ